MTPGARIEASAFTTTPPACSSTNHGGHAYEDVIWKSTFAELWLFCNFSMQVKYPTNGPQGAPFKQILRIKELLLYAYWRCRQNHKCRNFTSLLWRKRHGILLKCVPLVQHAYILPFNQSNSPFVTSSFPLLSWKLKLPDEEGDSNESITIKNNDFSTPCKCVCHLHTVICRQIVQKSFYLLIKYADLKRPLSQRHLQCVQSSLESCIERWRQEIWHNPPPPSPPKKKRNEMK